MGDLRRVLTIMGSGETAPTMVTTHQELLAMLPADARAVLVETPYGFQENATEISERTIDYFRRRVGHDLTAIGPRTPSDQDGPGWAATIATLQDAHYVFAGPGSPTYALAQWRATAFADVLDAKLRHGGIVTFASAAAVGLGRVAVPVYEVYKVGQDPQWVPGLDLTAIAGIDAAVIPHFDNAEGGTHDTRFCYLGARRLDVLERALDAAALVIGVDEHTALILDLDAGSATVRGRGGVTIRRDRRTLHVLPTGTRISLAELQQGNVTVAGVPQTPPEPPPTDETGDDGATRTLTEQVQAATAAFDTAIDTRDAKAAVTAILALEAAIAQWAADTTQSDETDRARTALRALIVRLGDVAVQGLRDPIEQIGPLANVVVRTRTALRRRRDFELADALRNDAADAGLELRDTSDGTTWHLLTDR
jgi:cyanophycinase-like exopeptidase